MKKYEAGGKSYIPSRSYRGDSPHSVRDHELTPDLPPQDLSELTTELLSLASALANGMPDDRPIVFNGFYTSVLSETPNIAWGRDSKGNDLSPSDTERIRRSIYQYFGVDAPADKNFQWRALDKYEEAGTTITPAVWHKDVCIEEVRFRRIWQEGYPYPPNAEDYQAFVIRVINRAVHKTLEE